MSSTASTGDKAARIAFHRNRYLELKAAGQAPGLPLPPPTPCTQAVLDPALVIHREKVPGGWYWSARLARGQALRLLNGSCTPGVSVMLWNADDPAERYNAGDTVKVQWTAALGKGRVLFSDMGRVLASIVEDSCGAHDTLVGGSNARSNLEKYGNLCGDAGLRNSRDNLLLAAAKFGLTRRDLAACISFFAPVVTDGEGRFGWREGAVVAGDFVDLRAEMNLLIAVSNCPHPLAPGKTWAPGEIEAIVWRAPPPGPDDFCRTGIAEARRGFENTDPLFQAGRNAQ
jgi:urea carboxylase-associated protein 2